MKISPSEFVVPIFGKKKENDRWIFLGTGFFFGDPAYLATANHVLGNMYEKIGIHIIDNRKFYYSSFVARQPKIDLAILKIENYQPPMSCKLAKDEDINFIHTIHSFEYGTTYELGESTVLSPATRMGNVTRTRNFQEKYGDGGDTMLELSFPALLGASGSPVVRIGNEIELWGIIVANASYHLLPAQIETVLTEDNSLIEEVKYLLPQALAVNVKHLQNFMNEIEPIRR
jgi:hypothetical protein